MKPISGNLGKDILPQSSESTAEFLGCESGKSNIWYEVMSVGMMSLYSSSKQYDDESDAVECLLSLRADAANTTEIDLGEYVIVKTTTTILTY